MNAVALAIGGVLVIVTALIRAAGASLVRTPRADALRDAAAGSRQAEVVADLLESRARLQPSLGIFHTGLLVMAAIPATWALTNLYSGGPLTAALVIEGLLFVFLGDVVPRSLGRHRPRTLAYRFAWLLRPAVALGDAATDLVTDTDAEETESEDDEQTAAADAEKRMLISQVLDFTDTIVREVMVPRTDMISVPALASTAVALDIVLAEGRSRIPVVGEGADDVQGILYARDLLTLMNDNSEPKPVTEIMRPATFVPETKRVSELLRDMQLTQTHLAIVVDEFGGTAGIVTIEDLLEELVGEIADEYDDEEPMVSTLADGGYLIDARLSIDDLSELMGEELPDDEWDTVGGLVLGLAGRVPREGESFVLGDHVFTCERVQGRRIAAVSLRAG